MKRKSAKATYDILTFDQRTCSPGTQGGSLIGEGANCPPGSFCPCCITSS